MALLFQLFASLSLLLVQTTFLIEAAGQKTGQDKTYLFALRILPSAPKLAYFDLATSEFHGLSVDVIKAVCKHANRKCDFYLVHNLDINPCWDNSLSYSTGLFHNWFDVCVTTAESKTYANVHHLFGPYITAVINGQIVSNEHNINADPATSKIGISRETPLNQKCLEDNGVKVGEAVIYRTSSELTTAVIKGEVPLGFVHSLAAMAANLTVVQDGFSCTGNKIMMMTRKEKRNEMLWYDTALKQLIDDGTYTKICEDFRRSVPRPETLQCLTTSEDV